MTQAELDAICGAWPGVTRSIKWEVDLVYSVSNKMFAVLCTLGLERGRLSFKVDPERFLELTDQPGFAPAPYMARAFWVLVTDPTRLGRAQLEAYLHRSYELVLAKLPQKTQRQLAGAPALAPAATQQEKAPAPAKSTPASGRFAPKAPGKPPAAKAAAPAAKKAPKRAR